MLQLALYSMMYSFNYGKLINKFRIELLIRGKDGPEIKIYEWDLIQEDLIKAESVLIQLIETIEAVFDGVNPKILFRQNPYTYYGSELNDYLKSL